MQMYMVIYVCMYTLGIYYKHVCKYIVCIYVYVCMYGHVLSTNLHYKCNNLTALLAATIADKG